MLGTTYDGRKRSPVVCRGARDVIRLIVVFFLLNVRDV